MIKDDQLLDKLREQLPEEDREVGSNEILAYLKGKYGKPEKEDMAGKTEQLSYRLPDREVRLFKSISSASLIGFIVIMAQAAAPPPTPCPSPGPAGSLTGTGSGTANVLNIMFLGLNGAIALATGMAAIDALNNYNALKAMVGPVVCPPPCTCVDAFVLPAAPAVTIARQWGLPIGVTVTVNITANLTCV